MTETKRLQLARVLIVEDHALLAENLESMLSDMGADVIAVANTVAQARQELDTGPFSLVLLDLQLGTENGLVIADECARAGIPVIMSTGHGDALGSALSPAEILLSKPYTYTALFMAVEEVLRRGQG